MIPHRWILSPCMPHEVVRGLSHHHMVRGKPHPHYICEVSDFFLLCIGARGCIHGVNTRFFV